jgi:hypothetical protein
MLLDGSDLCRLGISYHSYGTVKRGRLVLRGFALLFCQKLKLSGLRPRLYPATIQLNQTRAHTHDYIRTAPSFRTTSPTMG